MQEILDKIFLIKFSGWMFVAFIALFLFALLCFTVIIIADKNEEFFFRHKIMTFLGYSGMLCGALSFIAFLISFVVEFFANFVFISLMKISVLEFIIRFAVFALIILSTGFGLKNGENQWKI